MLVKLSPTIDLFNPINVQKFLNKLSILKYESSGLHKENLNESKLF